MSKEAKENENEEKSLEQEQVDEKSKAVSDEEMYVYEAFIAEQGY